MIAITQAEMPIFAPTEMSKFPEIMSSVAPAATRPSTDTCSMIFSMLFSPKNRGLMRPVTTARATWTTSRKNHCSRKMDAALRMSHPEEMFDERFLGSLAPVEHAGEPTSPHDADAVAHRNQFRHVGRHHDDAFARLRQLHHDAEDLGAGADVHALGRLVEDVNQAVDQKPAADDGFLLVAAGKLGDGLLVLVRHGDEEAPHHVLHPPPLRGEVQHRRLVALVVDDGDVLGHAPGRE